MDFLVIFALLAVILGLALRDEMRFRAVKERAEIERTLMRNLSQQLKGNLTASKWFVEMLLSKEAGTLHIAQLEFLKKVEDANAEAIRQLDEAVEKVSKQ